MSTLRPNFAVSREPENQLHHRNAKQYGASELPSSTIKKTALADVKNILAQRTVQSAKKPPASVTKPSISKKNLFGFFSDKENDVLKKEIQKDVDMSQTKAVFTTSNSVLMNKENCETNEEFEEPICCFCNENEDYYTDFMFKSITITKSQIDKLALDWERKPVVGKADMRTIGILPEIPNNIDPVSDWSLFDYELNEPDISLLNDIPAVESIFDSEDFEE